MLWIVVLLMCCQRTVESKECINSEIIVGRSGDKLNVKFPSSDSREEYNKYIPGRYGQKIIQNKIDIQDLTKESEIRFRNMKDLSIQHVTYKGHWAEQSIFWMSDTLVVKIQELQPEDAGIYWIELNSIYLNPVLKAEDNYSTILQLECHSVSTSIGDCQLYNSMYIMWYKNGMRMTELDPTLSQINVTVDHNGGKFTCLATEYHPCYHRLQTTKHYDDGLNIEECDNETSSVKPHHAPIGVKKETDQRKTTLIPHGEATKKSTLSSSETGAKWLIPADLNTVIIAVSVVLVIVIIVAVIVIVIMVIKFKKLRKKKKNYRIVYRKKPKKKRPETVIYAELDLNTPNGNQIRGIKPEPEVEYSTIDFTKKAPPMPKDMEVDSDDDDWF